MSVGYYLKLVFFVMGYDVKLMFLIKGHVLKLASVSLALNDFHYMIMLTLTFVIILHLFKMVPCLNTCGQDDKCRLCWHLLLFCITFKLVSCINTCDVNKTINAYVDLCYYFASLLSWCPV